MELHYRLPIPAAPVLKGPCPPWMDMWVVFTLGPLHGAAMSVHMQVSMHVSAVLGTYLEQNF